MLRLNLWQSRAGRQMTASEKKSFRQIVEYLAVGGGTALLELVLFQFLYAVIQLGPAISNVIAVVIATASNYTLNGTVTFKAATNRTRSIVLYCLLFVFNTAFSSATISYLVDLGCPALPVKLATMCCIVCWNFFLYKKVVFV